MDRGGGYLGGSSVARTYIAYRVSERTGRGEEEVRGRGQRASERGRKEGLARG